MDIKVLDHLIITTENYCSLSDEGVALSFLGQD